jgi:acyl-CoA synthetase (NDP forming)
VIAVCTPTHVAPIDGVAGALAAVAAEAPGKPLVANLVGYEGIPEVLREPAVPCFPFPEPAAQALGRAAWYADWLRRPPGTVPKLDGIDIRRPRQLVAEFLAAHPDGGWLDPVAAGEVLASFGIHAVTPTAVTSPPGVETIAGVIRDAIFGPLVMFGLGGTAAELLGDRVLRVAPLTDTDADEMIRSLRSSPLLFGYRGAVPVDAAALADVLLRLSALGQQVPELAELDLNPLIATPAGVAVVDWRMRLVPASDTPGHELRRLR